MIFLETLSKFSSAHLLCSQHFPVCNRSTHATGVPAVGKIWEPCSKPCSWSLLNVLLGHLASKSAVGNTAQTQWLQHHRAKCSHWTQEKLPYAFCQNNHSCRTLHWKKFQLCISFVSFTSEMSFHGLINFLSVLPGSEHLSTQLWGRGLWITLHINSHYYRSDFLLVIFFLFFCEKPFKFCVKPSKLHDKNHDWFSNWYLTEKERERKKVKISPNFSRIQSFWAKHTGPKRSIFTQHLKCNSTLFQSV